MIQVNGESNESIVLDGDWFEGGPLAGFVTAAGNRAKVDEIVAGLEKGS